MPRHIHFVGIGGVGMAALAYILAKRGFRVSGCDKYASPRTQWLKKSGIHVSIGHDVRHLDGVDELIVTPAIPPDLPEYVQARQHETTWGLSPTVAGGLSPMRIRMRGSVLAECVNQADGIAVCGTHGKTTTATYVTKLLQLLGTDPSWCIGGECGTMPVAGVGTGPFVVEADESDGTLAEYRAQILVETTVDYDHPEHFKTPEAYRACFVRAERQAKTVIRSWELDARDWPELRTLVIGEHNVANARAAVEVALRRGFTHEQIAAVLPQALAERPDRRFQRLWPLIGEKVADFAVYTDYAHHPAELACAVGMAAQLSHRRVRVLFQPHRHSRTARLRDAFPPAFAEADEIVLLPVYAAFEKPVPGGDIADLYAAFRSWASAKTPRHPAILLARSREEAWRHVFLTRQPGDVVLLAGAGDIIDLTERIRTDLTERADAFPPLSSESPAWRDLSPFSGYRVGGKTRGGGATCIVGSGTNRWFSDCASDVALCRAPTELADLPTKDAFIPAGRLGATLLTEYPALAFMAGVPGTVGGWCTMNAGAFGDAFGAYVERVLVRLPDGSCQILDAASCGFGYRQSAIPGLVLGVALTPAARLPGSLTRAETLARRKRFPPRTCGSVFKNPPRGEPAGALLEKAGAKNLAVGGARVWQQHANVIVAEDGATASDVLALMRLMRLAVYFKFGVLLNPEVMLEGVAS